MNYNNEVSSFKVLYVFSILLALGTGYFLGKKYNPKPPQVVIEQITEQKTIEKVVKYDVIVEKEVNSLPNFIRYNGEEVDCSEIAKAQLMKARSQWVNEKKPTEKSLQNLTKAVKLFEESQYSWSKSTLLKKIKCRLELNQDEVVLLAELIQIQSQGPYYE